MNIIIYLSPNTLCIPKKNSVKHGHLFSSSNKIQTRRCLVFASLLVSNMHKNGDRRSAKKK